MFRDAEHVDHPLKGTGKLETSKPTREESVELLKSFEPTILIRETRGT